MKKNWFVTLAAVALVLSLGMNTEVYTQSKGKPKGKSSSLTTAKEIGRDGRFIAYDNGTVSDTRTNLMWAAKDNGSDINWAGAMSYSEYYEGGGYTDWRLPTQNELAGLYNVNKSYRAIMGSEVHLTELIHLSCVWIWASETTGSDAAIFQFDHGIRNWHGQSSSGSKCALPVRSGK